jgi:hypothetical protein
MIIGFFGFFFPFFYALLPVHEADICLCSFYADKIKGKKYPALTTHDFAGLEILNLISTYTVNFMFMIALIWMVYKIRHINDDTKIKSECSLIVFWWLALTVI